MRRLSLFMLACIAASAFLFAPTHAQDDGVKAYAPKLDGDITAVWGAKELSVGADITAEDRFVWRCLTSGDVTATGNGASSRAAVLNQVLLTADVKERGGEGEDAKKLGIECHYNLIDVQNSIGGSTWGLFVSTSEDESSNKLWKDGKAAEPQSRDLLPVPSAVKSAMSNAVAYARLGERNLLTRPSHAIEFGRGDGKNLPQRIVDPVAFLRLLFAGYGGIKATPGTALELLARLAVDTAGMATAEYSLRLTPKLVYGKDANATAMRFEIEAIPGAASVELHGGIAVVPPTLRGSLLLDVKKGVVMALDLTGDYAPVAGSKAEVRGKITWQASLIDPEAKK